MKRSVVNRFKTAHKFSVGDEVRIKPSHGFKAWHGDTGEIEKKIPINKAYVELKEHGRVLVDLDDLEPVSGKTAANLTDAAFERMVGSIEDSAKKMQAQVNRLGGIEEALKKGHDETLRQQATEMASTLRVLQRRLGDS
jgi:hypothetical protein